MADVLRNLVRGKRADVLATCNALLQLPQLAPFEQLVKFVLPHQHNVQELFVLGLEIRKQANLFERLDAQPVSLVDKQYRDSPIRLCPDEKFPKRAQAI